LTFSSGGYIIVLKSYENNKNEKANFEAHGGEMLFESCPNAGTKVNIYLPCGVKGE
jgi:hypothetical protein